MAPATPSPTAEPRRAAAGAPRRRRRLPLPTTLQGRLTLTFVAVVAVSLVVVSLVVVNRVDEYFSRQEQGNLRARATSVADITAIFLVPLSANRPIVGPDNTVDPTVRRFLEESGLLPLLANDVAQANVLIRLGQVTRDTSGTPVFVPAAGDPFSGTLEAMPLPGQAREQISYTTQPPFVGSEGSLNEWAMEVTLSDPYTYRASTVATVSGILAVMTLAALAFAVVIAAILARRFTTPIRRLTQAARALEEGDLAQRVPVDVSSGGSDEIIGLSHQFNTMADRLEESVEIIRRDRDRSREFLADVSHELRTPLAALRTFNELLKERAGEDPAARTEFLEASGQQIDRLDWLAQNLLELSKLDSGLVLLDLRPDDLRACVESAVEQADAAARKRGVGLVLHLPDHPVRVRHDPQRIGQVVSNLVGNALKFTGRGGSVTVDLKEHGDGARIVVRDSGMGIPSSELPHIFERFYRGTLGNEARGSGSGLGLAIVKSVVDMHAGRISVESRVGEGSTFTVTLPRDPRTEPVAAPDTDAERPASSTVDEAERPPPTIGSGLGGFPSTGESPGPVPVDPGGAAARDA